MELNKEDRGQFLRECLGLFTEEEVCIILDITTDTLANWRSKKNGPDYCKLGKSVFYRKKDLEEWIGHNVVPTNRVCAE